MTQPIRTLQKGSLRELPRANGRFAWEWRYVDPVTGGYRSKTFSGSEFPEQPDIERHLRPFVSRLNDDDDDEIIVDPTVADLLDRFIAEENLLEIKGRKPGERSARKDELAYSTVVSYLSLCNRIREAWGTVKLDEFKPLKFQNWLKNVNDAPRTKGHLKSFVHRLFGKAKLYRMLDWVENPIDLVEVRGISKRRRKPAVLAIEQFWKIHSLLPEPYSIMAFIEQCTGLRVDELLALRWAVVDFERLSMEIKEGVVHGRIGPVKTECSQAEFPLDPDFAAILLEWKRRSSGSELLFPSPDTGRCYHACSIQKWIRRAGWCLVDCPECEAKAGKPCTMIEQNHAKRRIIQVHDTRKKLAIEQGLGSIGWHTFRHTHRSLHIQFKTPLEIQQALLRHASLATTGIYGGPPMESLREANSIVVREILLRRSSKQTS